MVIERSKKMELKIGARSFEIKSCFEQQINRIAEVENICGFTDYYQGKIYINNEMSKDVREETLLHEILHTLLDNSGIEEVSRQVKEGAKLGELVATILAPRLHLLLKQNKLENLIESI